MNEKIKKIIQYIISGLIILFIMFCACVITRYGTSLKVFIITVTICSVILATTITITTIILVKKAKKEKTEIKEEVLLYTIRCSNLKEKDIIDKMEEQEDKQKYIKELIKADIRNSENIKNATTELLKAITRESAN